MESVEEHLLYQIDWNKTKFKKHRDLKLLDINSVFTAAKENNSPKVLLLAHLAAGFANFTITCLTPDEQLAVDCILALFAALTPLKTKLDAQANKKINTLLEAGLCKWYGDKEFTTNPCEAIISDENINCTLYCDKIVIDPDIREYVRENLMDYDKYDEFYSLNDKLDEALGLLGGIHSMRASDFAVIDKVNHIVNSHMELMETNKVHVARLMQQEIVETV